MSANDHFDTEQLIYLVKRYPELYDPNHKDNSYMQKREEIWNSIAKELDAKVEVCKSKWNILRSGYRRALKTKNYEIPTGRCRKWRFMDDLSFLKDCFPDLKPWVFENYSNASSDNVNEFISIVNEPPKLKFKKRKNSEERPVSLASSSSPACEPEMIFVESEQKNDPNEIDPLRYFFLSLAETVRTLPPVLQAEVKADVFKVVSAAEVRFLTQKQKT